MDGCVKSASLSCVLFYEGVRQVREANPDNGSWCPAGTQEISVAEVPVCADDHDRRGDVYVQAVQGSSSIRDIRCVRLG